MNIPTTVVALFCEDIRQEATGQFSLVGILSDNGAVPPPPDTSSDVQGIIPKLALYVRINFDVQADLGPISFTLTTPDGMEIPAGAVAEETVARARATRDAGNPMGGIITVLKLQNFPLKKLGRIIFKATIGSQEYLAGFLNVTTEGYKP